MNDGSHICSSVCGCLDVLVVLVLEHFTVLLLTLSVLVFSEFVGGQENIVFLCYEESPMARSTLSL